MDAITNAITCAALTKAIETRDGRALTRFTTDDAVLRIVESTEQTTRSQRRERDRDVLG